jgi:lysylphosphatidylglycerol synthetase-like protein (DUF2156 family)
MTLDGMGLPRAASLPPTYRVVPWWLRAFLLINVVQDAGIGLSGWVSPSRSLLPLKDLTPLNGRFVASLYLGGGVVILVAALVRRAVDTRLALYSLLVITVLVLVMTIAYWDRFTVDGVPWQWMATYVLDPVVVVLALFSLGLGPAAEPGRTRLTGLFVAQAVVLGVTGVALLLAAPGVLRAWPWTLTPLLSRVYAAFFLAFAVGAALAALERRPTAVAGFLLGSLTTIVLSLSVSLVHLARFDHGSSRWVWFGLHVLGTAAMVAALLGLRRPARGPVPTVAAAA